jgi:hypothetical protein
LAARRQSEERRQLRGLVPTVRVPARSRSRHTRTAPSPRRTSACRVEAEVGAVESSRALRIANGESKVIHRAILRRDRTLFTPAEASLRPSQPSIRLQRKVGARSR